MRVLIIGGGPGGLYLSILLKARDPRREVVVLEREAAGVTFGFGVVFSDATLGALAEADPASHAAITARFAHWDAIDIFYRGECLRSVGHGFAGLSRQALLDVLAERAHALGVDLRYGVSVDGLAGLNALAETDPSLRHFDLVVATDGLHSRIREDLAEHFAPKVQLGATRFVWLGSTRPFEAFTFDFEVEPARPEAGIFEDGLWRLHAYNFEAGRSTFIAETTEANWRACGLDKADEATTAAWLEHRFARVLGGHPLLTNRSIWRQFPTVTCGRWHHGNLVLLGDAAHTAHFSVGSGTRLAMEDSIALAAAMEDFAAGQHPDVPSALAAYEAHRRPAVAQVQRAAEVSQTWFEQTERYHQHLSPLTFAFSLLTRSLRITHENLRQRDPDFVRRVDAEFAERAAEAAHLPLTPGAAPAPPMFAPFSLRGLTLANRIVVSPMCTYSAKDGDVHDWHLVHLGSRAMGGAGLVMTEMTDVSAEGRITPGCAGLYTRGHADAWARIVRFVHEHTPAKIGVQLGHAGRKGSTRLMWEGMDRPLPEGNWPLVAPSPLPYFPESQVPEPMTRAQMDTVRDDFVRATRLAERAGFDLVEVHLAHGYLLASFLSPITNRRDDAYGGSLENRMRFPLEVFAAVRAEFPSHLPVSARISATDWLPEGFDADDAVALALALKAAGCDLVDVSTGQTDPAGKPSYGRLYQTPYAERVRLEAGIATITVGNISSYADANSVLAAGRADLVALARAHQFDPYWTRHAAYEQGLNPAWPPQYVTVERYNPRFEWSPRGNGNDSERT
jgi:anthraniloyl-CoA monooxygenase